MSSFCFIITNSLFVKIEKRFKHSYFILPLYIHPPTDVSRNLSHHKFSPIHTTISTINIIVLFTYGISNIFTALKAHDIPNKLIIAFRGLSPMPIIYDGYDFYQVQMDFYHYALEPISLELHQTKE